MKWNYLVASATALSACMNHDPSTIKDEVPASKTDYAELGQAYNSYTKDFLNLKCVTGKTRDELGNTEGVLELVRDLDMSQVVTRLGGGLSVGVEFPSVRAGVDINMAKEMASSPYSQTYHLSWTTRPKKLVLSRDAYELTSLGKKYSADPEHLLKRCGDEYVAAIEYGASLNVTLRVEFRNQEDKLKIGGGINFSLSPVTVAVKTDNLSSDAKKSVKLSIIAVQRGGDPIQLLKVIPENVITCDLADPKPCLDIFAAVDKYAKEDIPTQFKDRSNYNVIRYFTEKYSESGLDELVPSNGYPELSSFVANKRREMDAAYQAASLDEKRASRLLGLYREWLKPEEAQKVKDVESKARANAQLFLAAAVACYDNPFDTNNVCRDRSEEVAQKKQVYSADDLNIQAVAAPK